MEKEMIWISYNDEGREVRGYFKLIEQTENYVKIESANNILTIPFRNINKIKEKIERRCN